MISTSWFVFNCNELDDGTSQLMPVRVRMWARVCGCVGAHVCAHARVCVCVHMCEFVCAHSTHACVNAFTLCALECVSVRVSVCVCRHLILIASTADGRPPEFTPLQRSPFGAHSHHSCSRSSCTLLGSS
jgi:hypothetical protein